MSPDGYTYLDVLLGVYPYTTCSDDERLTKPLNSFRGGGSRKSLGPGRALRCGTTRGSWRQRGPSGKISVTKRCYATLCKANQVLAVTMRLERICDRSGAPCNSWQQSGPCCPPAHRTIRPARTHEPRSSKGSGSRCGQFISNTLSVILTWAAGAGVQCSYQMGGPATTC